MKVLVISAHMDDEVLGVGGTIAKHVARGDEVHVCVVCNRAYDHRYEPSLVEEEKAATRAAAEVLGYKELHFLNLKDERLDECELDVIVPIEDCVNRVRPNIVYTHHRGDVNQDHRVVFRASLVACRSIAPHKVSRFLSYEVPSSTEQAPPFPEYAFSPNVYVEIATYMERKLEALTKYQRESRPFPHPRSKEAIQILAGKRGVEVGLTAAEAFALIREEW